MENIEISSIFSLCHDEVNIDDDVEMKPAFEVDETYLRVTTCGICMKDFSKAGLKRHMAVHRRRTLHKCSLCNEEFKRKGDLNKHFLSHNGEEIFKCEKCGRAFPLLSKLTQHLLSGHKGKECARCPVMDESLGTVEPAKRVLSERRNRSEPDASAAKEKLKTLAQENTSLLEQNEKLKEVAAIENDKVRKIVMEELKVQFSMKSKEEEVEKFRATGRYEAPRQSAEPKRNLEQELRQWEGNAEENRALEYGGIISNLKGAEKRFEELHDRVNKLESSLDEYAKALRKSSVGPSMQQLQNEREPNLGNII